MVIPATVKDEKVNLKIEKVNLKVIDSVKAMLGDLVFIDLGWNDIESIKRFTGRTKSNHAIYFT